jgi:hypothetical protein
MTHHLLRVLLWGATLVRLPLPGPAAAWLAGGAKGRQVIGATADFGLRAVKDRVHVNDLHATILRLLGLDHRKLTFLFEGREQRPTEVGGEREFADRLLA